MIIRTKKGMASLYLVAFSTLILGILTMSFARIMLTESEESRNSDLSQSAYDSALAGIEDAKTAIIMYNACLLDRSREGCDDIINTMENNFENSKEKKGSCDIVSEIINGNKSPGEVQVGNESLDQAYTCVTIANDATDFRDQFNTGEISKTIPVRVKEGKYKEVVAFELEWYSREKDDDGVFSKRNFMHKTSEVFTELYNKNVKPFGNKNDAKSSLPILSFEIFQTDTEFSMYQLDLNNENNTGTDHAMITMYPDKEVKDYVKDSNSGNFLTNFISAQTLLGVSNKDSQNSSKTPQPVYCATNDTDYAESKYRCRATIELPATYGNADEYEARYANTKGSFPRSEHTFLIRISLPYGEPTGTDFSVKACTTLNDDGLCIKHADWVGLQFIVDSTGRASTLYRRVVARINAVDSEFIYPEYAIQSSDNSSIEKDFYATKKCWSTDGNGNSSTCANNGNASSEFPQ